MKNSLGVLLGVLLIQILVVSCSESGKSTVLQIDTPIEEFFQLDQTTVGVSTISTGMDVPWEITWGPDNWIWYSQIKGEIGKINPGTGEKVIIHKLDSVYTRTTPGLLGIALHPDLENFPYLFALHNQKVSDEKIVLNISRFRIDGDRLTDQMVLLQIPGARGHNGSRIKVGADGLVYISSGEAARAEESQNVNDPGGKVLRMNIDGSIPDDNPFMDNPVWAWGFRNPQGLVLTEDGRIYTSDHGDATDDEVNFVQKGGNYGWPDVRGICDTEEEKVYCSDSVIIESMIHWTPTIAPAGIDYYNSKSIPEWNNSLLLTTLKGSSLRVLKLSEDGRSIVSEDIFFDHKYGRIRDLCISPEGDVYISTSNRDWYRTNTPEKDDDRIIRLFNISDKEIPDSVLEYKYRRNQDAEVVTVTAESLYSDFCSSCHKKDGKGVEGTFPPLSGTKTVLGESSNLINTVLKGVSGEIVVNGVTYNEHMPSFSFLKDDEIAKILTYVRSSFGNEASEVTEEEINAVRTSNEGGI
ncbi:PQQ-dependent sugar dehydrogenase [Membranihabitans maritimus]|uniref:PQQ-dependent sugar dehydrogenase n=1 Tax=Membranihabitans maritimus TaxID=2904244 RepID=UPI001F15B0BB|nr:PQQ-dependent sugar dehydrogenase [Membranihabitans maritimus]